MKQDFDIIAHHFDREDIRIYPLSDLHIGAPEFNLPEWVAFKKLILADKRAYIVIAGDLMNNATRSSVSNVFEETMRPSEQKKWLAAELHDIKGRILCAVPGNHEARSGKDVDDCPLYDVLCKLDIEDVYRPNAAFMAIRFGKMDGNGALNPTCSLMVTHGAGGGILTGAGVNRNERFGYVFDGLDILITGHTHKPLVTNPSKICIDLHNGKITRKPFKCVTATSWMNYGGYALRKDAAACVVCTTGHYAVWQEERIHCNDVRYIMEVGKDIPFERIRRITGYLVGTMDKWNDAKKAEERDRVKHL